MSTVDIDRKLLLKLIGMLGSDFEGERTVAGTKIKEMAASHGITITELMALAHAAPAAPAAALPAVVDLPILTQLEQIDLDCPALSDWEKDFIDNVVSHCSRDYELTDKRLLKAEAIIKKVTRYYARRPRP